MTHPPPVRLRPVTEADLPALFRQQSDAESNRLAGTKPRDAESFRRAWEGILADPGVVARVVLLGEDVVGLASCWRKDGLDHVAYWIGREHWGRGFATAALRLLLAEVPRRPLRAVAFGSNAASIRVLEKCGFRCTGRRTEGQTDRYLAGEVADFILE